MGEHRRVERDGDKPGGAGWQRPNVPKQRDVERRPDGRQRRSAARLCATRLRRARFAPGRIRHVADPNAIT
jgi:hypothetical protein